MNAVIDICILVIQMQIVLRNLMAMLVCAKADTQMYPAVQIYHQVVFVPYVS